MIEKRYKPVGANGIYPLENQGQRESKQRHRTGEGKQPFAPTSGCELLVQKWLNGISEGGLRHGPNNLLHFFAIHKHH
jgi:hypothetical protein